LKGVFQILTNGKRSFIIKVRQMIRQNKAKAKAPHVAKNLEKEEEPNY